MSKRPVVWLRCSAALVIARFASGCAAGPSSGPMNLGGPEQWLTCASSKGDRVTFGDLFSIPGSQPATLSAVRLVNAKGIELEESYVLSAEDGYVMKS